MGFFFFRENVIIFERFKILIARLVELVKKIIDLRIYFLYCDILFMKILKLYMLLVRGIMVILLNNRVEFKIEVVILFVWLD